MPGLRSVVSVMTFTVVLGTVRIVAAEPVCPPAATIPTRAQVEAAVRNARDRGALWTIEKDGRGSWLYGTIHLGNLEVSVPGPKTLQALRAADVIALELDPGDPDTMRRLTAPQASTPHRALPSALLERTKALVRRACVPWESLANIPPPVIAAALSILDARWDGYDPSYANEFVLRGFASATNKPVRPLESVGTQLTALGVTTGVGDKPDGGLKTLEATVTALEQNLIRPLFKVLFNAWSEGDLATIASYEQWCGCTDTTADRADFERMMFDRNPDIAAAIDVLHRQGHRVFAATGILHMVGERGVPALLEKLGYKVERVMFETK